MLSLSATAQRYRPSDFTFSYLFAQTGEKDLDEVEDSIRQLVLTYVFNTPDPSINALGGLLSVAESKRSAWTVKDWLYRWLGNSKDSLSTLYQSYQYSAGIDRKRALTVLNGQLWMQDKGYWAAFKDARGLRRLHEHATVASLCAPVMADACSWGQASQAVRHLNALTIPSHDLLPAALACFKAGYNMRGYQLLKSGLQSQLYQGQSPVDSIRLAACVLMEGLFGILPEPSKGRCIIRPGFPDDWDSASVHTPNIDYCYRRVGNQLSLDVTQRFRQPQRLVLRMNMGMGEYRDIVGTTERHQTFRVKAPVKWPDVTFKNTYDQPTVASNLGFHKPIPGRKFYTQRITAFYNDSINFHADSHSVREAEYELGGVPFLVSLYGPNIACVSYPDTLSVPVKRKAECVWVLLSGTTNDRERFISNGLVIAHYQDGTTDSLSLVNPDNWGPNPAVDIRRLCLLVDGRKKLASVEIRPLSNDITIGLIGLTLQ